MLEKGAYALLAGLILYGAALGVDTLYLKWETARINEEICKTRAEMSAKLALMRSIPPHGTAMAEAYEADLKKKRVPYTPCS